MEVDYLIVGGGLAGTSLAFRLLQEKHSFVVVDPYQIESASLVSAGICNPVVFRRLNLSWMADSLLNEATSFYRDMEHTLKVPLINQRSIVRVFSSQDEKAFWNAKINEPQLHHRLELTDHLPATLHGDFGGGLVKGVLQVQIAALFGAVRALLVRENKLIAKEFDYKSLKIERKGIRWNEIKARRLVFCEGAGLRNNPFFNWLPLKPVKGEALILTIEGLPEEQLYSKKLTLCPLGDSKWWAGATYNWEDLSIQTTKTARNTLITQLNDLLKLPFDVLEQKAGIRPAAADRRPLVGQHPEHQPLYVFNGFGTKGSMIAPYFSKRLLAFMEKSDSLPEEVNIQRYHHLR